MATQFANGKIVTDGLVLCLDAADLNSYPTTGTTWFDLAGSNNGTLTNGPTFSGTGASSSIVFDGVDDYATCGLITQLPSGTQNRTLMGWVQDNSITDYSGDLISIFGYGTNNAEGNFFMFSIGGITFNNRKLVMWTYSRNHISSFSMDRNVWTHIAVTVTAGVTYPKITIYKNGIPDNGSEQNINTLNSQPFEIADSIQSGSYDGKFNGKINEILGYNRALSPQEILQNYNVTKIRFGIS